jgi:hypothetical protein
VQGGGSISLPVVFRPLSLGIYHSIEGEIANHAIVTVSYAPPVGLFRRKREETLNEQLLREAGYDPSGRQAGASEETVSEPPEPWSVGPPGPMDPRSLGVAFGAVNQRPREWDAVTPVEAPELQGHSYEFAALPDGSLIVDDTVDEDLSPLAEAVERALAPPYRALAVRTDDRWWMVSARKLVVVELALDGEELELSDVGGERHFAVDGIERSPTKAPSTLVAFGQTEGADYVVQARRLDENLWEVTPSAL